MADPALRRALELTASMLQSVAKSGNSISEGSSFKINGRLYTVRDVLNMANEALETDNG